MFAARLQPSPQIYHFGNQTNLGERPKPPFDILVALVILEKPRFAPLPEWHSWQNGSPKAIHRAEQDTMQLPSFAYKDRSLPTISVIP